MITMYARQRKITLSVYQERFAESKKNPTRSESPNNPHASSILCSQNTSPPHDGTRSSAHNRIEPTKHLLKQYLARTHLTVLASAFTCREEHIFFRTSQSVVQILAAAASPIVFRLTHKRWTLNIFRHVGQ
jgi:hypothetical protein